MEDILIKNGCNNVKIIYEGQQGKKKRKYCTYDCKHGKNGKIRYDGSKNKLTYCPPDCYFEKTQEFIKKSKEIHGEGVYSYENTVLINIYTKVKIKHIECNWEFEQYPNDHLRGYNGCDCCSCSSKLSESYIKMKVEERGNKFIKTYIPEKGGRRIVFECKKHGIVDMLWGNFQQEAGCNECGYDKIRLDENVLIEKLEEKFDVDDIRYENNRWLATVRCKNFNHLNNERRVDKLLEDGCKFCHDKPFSEHYRAKYWNHELNEDTPDCLSYASHEKRWFNCEEYNCGRPFLMMIKAITLQDQWHPNCNLKHGCSKISCKIIDSIEELFDVKIQHKCFNRHKESDFYSSEYKIPEMKNKPVDGYIKEHNTVIQYHGNTWHGHPKYIDDLVSKNHFGNLYSELYKNTINSDNNLKKLGYIVISIWEHEYQNAENKEEYITNLFSEHFTFEYI